MAMALDETTPGDPHNALFLAQACSLAYFDEPAAAAAFREQLGLEARLISVDNTQVYVARMTGPSWWRSAAPRRRRRSTA